MQRQVNRMSIDEAIEHERELVKVYRCVYECECDFYGSRFVHDNGDRFDCIKDMREHEQIAEWLEDYKKIKMLVPIEQALKSEYSKGYSKAENDYYAQSEKDRQSSYDCGYNKAIDDIREKLMQNGFIYTQHALDVFNDIAEQLKAGERD